MTIMKKRGARRPRPKGAAKTKREEPAPEGGSFVPLQIFAEGDSWFDYPIPFFGGGIIPRLENRFGVPILHLAKAGDEVRYMLGVEERTLLTEHLTNGCPAGGPWDVLLFSGGGNDIVDNPMACGSGTGTQPHLRLNSSINCVSTPRWHWCVPDTKT
jgi:hypothetical protein